MRIRLFVPDFLFDFYSDIGSTATPSALCNYSRAGLFVNFVQNRQVRFSCTYIKNGQICTDFTILIALMNNMRLEKFFCVRT